MSTIDRDFNRCSSKLAAMLSKIPNPHSTLLGLPRPNRATHVALLWLFIEGYVLGPPSCTWYSRIRLQLSEPKRGSGVVRDLNRTPCTQEDQENNHVWIEIWSNQKENAEFKKGKRASRSCDTEPSVVLFQAYQWPRRLYFDDLNPILRNEI